LRSGTRKVTWSPLTGIATTGPAAFSLKDKPHLAMAIAAAR
jgi:hypothetical protein